MTRPQGLSQWHHLVSTHLPHLTQPQIRVLVLWSMGIVLAHHCGLTSVSTVLAYLLDRNSDALREQLRDWWRCAAHKSGAKRGHKRRSLDVSSCFPALLRWVLALHPPHERRLALALDASTLGQRFTLLSICVLIRGCAVPIAWRIVPASRAGAWRPHWEALFAQFHDVVPTDWTVIVSADRGLWAKWLFTSITALGWHPLLRINRQGQYRPAGESAFRPLSQVVGKGEGGWAGRVTCFATKARQLECTLLARWEERYREPWLLLTDLGPEEARVAWYGMRAWIECGYKDAKRGGWHWEQTKMEDEARAERLWLGLALATLWVVSVGCAAEVKQTGAGEPEREEQSEGQAQRGGRGQGRSLSCFRRGQLLLLAALVRGEELPPLCLWPEPWPESLDSGKAQRGGQGPHYNAALPKPYP